jgi:hypothetical protein
MRLDHMKALVGFPWSRVDLIHPQSRESQRSPFLEKEPMKTWNALWASLVKHSVKLRWKAVLLALFASAVLTATGCNPSVGDPGAGPHNGPTSASVPTN